MVDIVDIAAAVFEIEQGFQDRKNVFFSQDADIIVTVKSQAHIHLDPADR